MSEISFILLAYGSCTWDCWFFAHKRQALRKHADWSRRLPRQIIIPQLEEKDRDDRYRKALFG